MQPSSSFFFKKLYKHEAEKRLSPHKYKYLYHLHLLLLPLMYSSTYHQHPSHHPPNSGVHLYFSDILVPLDDEDMLSLEKFTAHLWLATWDGACFFAAITISSYCNFLNTQSFLSYHYNSSVHKGILLANWLNLICILLYQV